MDGNHPDDCLYTEEDRPRSNGTLARKLIDAIVDEVCKCTEERDQQVQLQVVRALLTIVATNNTQVHERSLLKVMSSLYYIHIASTTPVNQSTAKASLMQLISIVFKKMEQKSWEFSESVKKLNSESDFAPSDSIVNQQMNSQRVLHSAKSLATTTNTLGRTSEPNASPIDTEGTFDTQGKNQDDIQSQKEPVQESLVTFTPDEQYAFVTLKFMIDQVCI